MDQLALTKTSRAPRPDRVRSADDAANQPALGENLRPPRERSTSPHTQRAEREANHKIRDDEGSSDASSHTNTYTERHIRAGKYLISFWERLCVKTEETPKQKKTHKYAIETESDERHADLGESTRYSKGSVCRSNRNRHRHS